MTRKRRQHRRSCQAVVPGLKPAIACVLYLWLTLATSAMARSLTARIDIVLILSSDAPSLQQAATGFKDGLRNLCQTGASCPSIVEVSPSELDKGLSRAPHLFVTVGSSAAQRALEHYPETPQLNLMVAKNTLSAPAGNQVSTLYLEQPPERLLDFVTFLLPERRRIGVLSTDASRTFVEQLEMTTERRGLILRDRMIEGGEHIGRQLHALNRTIDLLLALPDPAIFNRQTLATILLACYQDQIPVIGFSAGMTRAGALASLYSTPESIGQEGAEYALHLLAGAPTFHTFPRHFELTINRRVAQALHLHLPTDAELETWRKGVR